MTKFVSTSLFLLALSAAPFSVALAEDVTLIAPSHAEPAPSAEPDAMNYFAAGAQHKRAVEEAAAANPAVPQEGMVPASELDTLPTALNLENKAKLVVKGGKLVTETHTDAAAYTSCDANNEGDECHQQAGAEPMETTPHVPQNHSSVQTLDAQLAAKTGTMAAEPAVGAANETVDFSGKANVENTALVDSERGAKMNIISNTDTGVQMSK